LKRNNRKTSSIIGQRLGRIEILQILVLR